MLKSLPHLHSTPFFAAMSFYPRRRKEFPTPNKTNEDDNKTKGVFYNAHFPQNFMRPYGKDVLDDMGTDCDIQT